MPKRAKSTKAKRSNSLKVKEPDLNVKAASIEWGKDFSLLNQLLTLLEINKRWRHGIFAPSNPKDTLFLTKYHYFVEIASALFSQHAHYGSTYLKKPFAFASAVKKKLESLPSKAKVGKTTRTNAYPIAWKSHRKEMIIADCTPACWALTLPYELLRIIFQIALRSNSFSGVDKVLASKLRILNSSINHFVTPIMFHTLTIRLNSHLKRFLLCSDDTKIPPLLHVRRVVLYPTSLTGRFNMFPADPVSYTLPGAIHTLVLNFGNKYAYEATLARCLSLCRGMDCRTLQLINHPVSKPMSIITTMFSIALMSHTLTTLDLPAELVSAFWGTEGSLAAPAIKFGEAFDCWVQGMDWNYIEELLPFRSKTLPMTIILRHTDVPALMYASLVISPHPMRKIRLVGWDVDGPWESWVQFTEREEFQSGSGNMFMGRLVRWDREE